MFLIAYCLLEVVLDPLWSKGLLLGELRGEWNMFPMGCWAKFCLAGMAPPLGCYQWSPLDPGISWSGFLLRLWASACCCATGGSVPFAYPTIIDDFRNFSPGWVSPDTGEEACISCLRWLNWSEVDIWIRSSYLAFTWAFLASLWSFVVESSPQPFRKAWFGFTT